MMNWTPGNYNYLYLLLALPVFWVLIRRFRKWRRSRQERFAEVAFRPNFFRKESAYRYIFRPLFSLAVLFLVLAFVDLLHGSRSVIVKRNSGNVVFLMDVSNSMNAEDVSPSRMERERELMNELLDHLEGQKAGIVVFAGNAQSIMPLTSDFSAVKTYIAGINPTIMQVQGTDFYTAVQEVVRAFEGVPERDRNVVMISDGEDNEQNTDAAAKLAAENKIRMITVGIGTREGAPVPEYAYGQMMGYKTDMYGAPVLSQLQPEALKKLASKTGGSYFDGNESGTAPAILRDLQKAASDTVTETTGQTADHHYQWFLAVSLLLFFIIYLTNPMSDLNI